MKIVFFSDVHGSPDSLLKLFDRAAEFRPDLLVMLGDALYHGPRNPLLPDYSPQAVVRMLNGEKERIVAVRGNCDSEVDQMLLEFPIMADYSALFADGVRFFLTHGHQWNENAMPPLPPGTVLAHGHTHMAELKRLASGIVLFNPGSISLPKSAMPASYGTWENGDLAVRKLDSGRILFKLTLPPLV